MKTPKLRPTALNMQGVAHLFVPLLVIVIVAIGGAYMLVASRAATLEPVSGPSGQPSLTLEAEKVFTVPPYNPLSANKFALVSDATASGGSAFRSTHYDTTGTAGYQNAGLRAKFTQPELMGVKVTGYSLGAKITNCTDDPLEYLFTAPEHYIGTQVLGEWAEQRATLPAPANTATYQDYRFTFKPLSQTPSYYIPRQDSPLELNLGVGYKAKPSTGNCKTSVAIDTVTLYYEKPAPDTIKPTISLTRPLNNSTVKGDIVVTASVTDNTKVERVEFFVDGKITNNIDYTAPYEITHPTVFLKVPDGQHVITATAYDTANNAATATVNVKLQNNSPATRQLLYQLWNPKLTDHMYTTSTAERDKMLANGYVSEGTAGYVSIAKVAGSVPLYRLYSAQSTDHFYTNVEWQRTGAKTSFRKYVDQGIVGYVMPSATAGTTPLYQVWSNIIADHAYTTSITQRNGWLAQQGKNYVDQGNAGFVFTAEK